MGGNVPPSRGIRFLAAAYIVCGVTKLLGGQFHHGPFTIDSATVDGTFFVWAFCGWKMPYMGQLFGRSGTVELRTLGLPGPDREADRLRRLAASSPGVYWRSRSRARRQPETGLDPA